MQTYLSLLKDVLDNGEERMDRTGTGTLSVFGRQYRYALNDTFPAVTTKKLAWKAVVSELLWFIEGSGDERRLAEILHGTRDQEKKTIWTGNAQAGYWAPKARFEGDVGRVYGVQWRSWKTGRKGWAHSDDQVDEEVDQLTALIDSLKKDPFGRRHIITAWNPGELDLMALPPCHCFAQFYVSKDMKLSCQMYQRSCDVFLGVPFNIASYSLFTAMIAQVCGLGLGELVHTLGDAHCYTNHLTQVKEQLTHTPLPLPTLWLNPEVKDIDSFKIDDIKLVGYTSYPSISAPMAV